MRRCLLVGSLIVVASVTPAFAESDQDARQTSQMMVEKFDAAYNKHDAAGIAALYAADAVFVPARPLPPLGPVVTGRQQIEEYFARAFKTFTSKTGKVVDAGSLGNGAVWFVEELHLSGQGQHGPLRLDGHVGGVLVRNGPSWQIRMVTTQGTARGLPPQVAHH